MSEREAWEAAVREGAIEAFILDDAFERDLRTALATLERHGCGDMTVSQVLAAARPSVVPVAQEG